MLSKIYKSTTSHYKIIVKYQKPPSGPAGRTVLFRHPGRYGRVRESAARHIAGSNPRPSAWQQRYVKPLSVLVLARLSPRHVRCVSLKPQSGVGHVCVKPPNDLYLARRLAPTSWVSIFSATTTCLLRQFKMDQKDAFTFIISVIIFNLKLLWLCSFRLKSDMKF